MRTRQLVFPFPLPRTHTGIPLGNGAFGALVWGSEPDVLCLTVSRNDFWDRRHGGRLPEGATYERLKEAYAQGDPEAARAVLSSGGSATWPRGAKPSTLLPCGRFELALKEGVALRRALVDCARGRVIVETTDEGATLELVMSPFVDVLWLYDPAALVTHINPRPAWEWCENPFVERGFSPPLVLDGPNEAGWVQSCPEDPTLCALARRGKDGGILVSLKMGADAEDAQAKTETAVAEVEKRSATAFLATADSWWQQYWARTPEVDLPAGFWSDFLLYAHYKWACATNPNAPCPCPLQGPWIEEYQFPPWGGDYTFNVNIQQIYSFGFCGGNLDHVLPLFDMLESAPFQETMRHNARALVGIDDGLLLTHSVNDQGRQCQLGFSPHSAIDQAVAAWLAHLYWLYYTYTGDCEFLRNRAMPFMRGVMRVYEAMLEERGDGALWLPVSVSPEYGVSRTLGEAPRQDGPNASMQLTCVHMLLSHLLDACGILGMDPDPAWRDIRARTPRFCTVTAPTPDGRTRIGIWEGQDLSACHRHHSHLSSIYPFDLVGDMGTRECEHLANGIEHWTRMGMGAWSEWCFPWAAIIQARWGLREAPYVLLNIWREVFINEGLTTVYLPRFHGVTAHRYADIDRPKEAAEIMQLEGTAAGATAIFEMLVHTRSAVVRVFPATPASWPDASFENVPQPGGLLVSAWRRKARTHRVVLRATRSGTFAVEVPDWAGIRIECEGVTRHADTPASIDMAPGDIVALTPDDME